MLGLCGALLSGPTEISLQIVSTWLNVQSICRLDSACCATVTRPMLLQLLSGDHFILTKLPVDPETVKSFAKCLGWARLKVRRLEIRLDADTQCQCDALHRYLNVRGSYITSIKFGSSRTITKSMQIMTAIVVQQCPDRHILLRTAS